jgi:hypothetical protein
LYDFSDYLKDNKLRLTSERAFSYEDLGFTNITASKYIEQRCPLNLYLFENALGRLALGQFTR